MGEFILGWVVKETWEPPNIRCPLSYRQPNSFSEYVNKITRNAPKFPSLAEMQDFFKFLLAPLKIRKTSCFSGKFATSIEMHGLLLPTFWCKYLLSFPAPVLPPIVWIFGTIYNVSAFCQCFWHDRCYHDWYSPSANMRKRRRKRNPSRLGLKKNVKCAYA